MASDKNRSDTSDDGSEYSIKDLFSKTSLKRIAFWSLAASIIVMPIWVLAGRAFIGGPVGWFFVIFFFTLGPVVFLYHSLVFILARSAKNHIRRRTYIALLVYYIGMFLSQASLTDGGDSEESIGSAMTNVGFSETATDFTFSLAIMISFVSALVLFIFLILDRKQKYRKKQ